MAIIFYFYYLLVTRFVCARAYVRDAQGTGTGQQPFPRMTVPCSRSPRTQYTRPVCACDTHAVVWLTRKITNKRFLVRRRGKTEKTPRNHSKIRNVAFAKGLNIFTDFNESVLIVRNRSGGRSTANPRRLVFLEKSVFSIKY